MGFPGGSAGKESACNEGDLSSIPGLGRERLPTPVFWPGEFHGLYSPWNRKVLDTTEQLSLHFTSLLPNTEQRYFKYSSVYMSIPNSRSLPCP